MQTSFTCLCHICKERKVALAVCSVKAAKGLSQQMAKIDHESFRTVDLQ